MSNLQKHRVLFCAIRGEPVQKDRFWAWGPDFSVFIWARVKNDDVWTRRCPLTMRNLVLMFNHHQLAAKRSQFQIMWSGIYILSPLGVPASQYHLRGILGAEPEHHDPQKKHK